MGVKEPIKLLQDYAFRLSDGDHLLDVADDVCQAVISISTFVNHKQVTFKAAYSYMELNIFFSGDNNQQMAYSIIKNVIVSTQDYINKNEIK